MCRKMGIYLMNSVNPFRLEGQKSIMYRMLEARDWEPPDWIIVPGGNLGNCSAFGKAFMELKELGPDQKDPAAGGHQRQRREHAERALQPRRTCAGTADTSMRQRSQKLYAAHGRSELSRRTRSPAPSRSAGR